MLEVLDCLFLLNKYDSSGSALKMLEDIKLSHWNQLDISTFYSHNICTITYCLYIVWKFRVHTRKFNVGKNLFCWIFLHISHTFLNHGTVFFSMFIIILKNLSSSTPILRKHFSLSIHLGWSKFWNGDTGLCQSFTLKPGLICCS